MNKKNTLLAVLVTATLLLSACKPSTDAAPPSSSEPPLASSPSSASAEPEPSSVTASSVPQMEVATQTKTIDGFTGGQVNNGTLHINGGIATLGEPLLNLDAELAKSGMTIRDDKEEIKTRTSFGDGGVTYISEDAPRYAMGMQFSWYNPFDEQDIKLIDTTLFKLEARTVTGDGDDASAPPRQEPVVVLPNGWYLDGAVSVADRMSLLPGLEPNVRPSDEYTWYTWYADSTTDEKTCTLALKFDNATGKIIEIQISTAQTSK